MRGDARTGAFYGAPVLEGDIGRFRLAERLYRPDASITAWRKLCERARGAPSPTRSLDDELAELAAPAANGQDRP